MALWAAVGLLEGRFGGVRSADKTVMYSVSRVSARFGGAFVTRTSLSRMLFPVFCALWARLPFALPLVCGSSLECSIESRFEGAEGSRSGKTAWLISTRGASDMVGGCSCLGYFGVVEK